MQESIPDYYKILGVPPTASDKEIREAFLALQKKYHPDVYKGADAHERSKEINEAWEWLRTAQRKAMYDTWRQSTTWKEELERERKAAQDEINRQQKEAEEHIERLARQRKSEVDEALQEAIRKARQERTSSGTGNTSYTSSRYTKSQPPGRDSSYGVDPTPQQTTPTSSYTSSDQILRPSFSWTPKTIVISALVLVVICAVGVGIVRGVSSPSGGSNDNSPPSTVVSFTADQSNVSVGAYVTLTVKIDHPLQFGYEVIVDFSYSNGDLCGSQITTCRLYTWTNCDEDPVTCTTTWAENSPHTVNYKTYLADSNENQLSSSNALTLTVTWS